MFRKFVSTVGKTLAATPSSLLRQEHFLKGIARLTRNTGAKFFSTSAPRRELMEFFEDKKNWGETNVRSGRSWKVDELRLKSNMDLHKLWYILLKERNMLLTMEQACKDAVEFYPNPERIDKVEDSMKNLEEVVRERNRAYFMLETGETGERPGAEEENFLGLPEYRQFDEYTVPKEVNKEYLKAKSEEPVVEEKEKAWFLARFADKQRRKGNNLRKLQRREIQKILRMYPNTDLDLLRQKYPDAKVDQVVERTAASQHMGNVKPYNYHKLRPGFDN